MSCSLCTGTMLVISQSLSQIVGGATQSIFPEVEAVLLGNTDYQRALEFVAGRKEMDRYRSMVDFLFCELHSEWQLACFRFYAGRGSQLKDQITPKQIMEYNNKLLKAIGVAHDLYCEKNRRRWPSWVWYKSKVREALMAS